jgi:hypothetical protein
MRNVFNMLRGDEKGKKYEKIVEKLAQKSHRATCDFTQFLRPSAHIVAANKHAGKTASRAHINFTTLF